MKACPSAFDGFLVCALALASCASPPPTKLVHVNTPPGLVGFLKHPTLRISDPADGRWTKGVPASAESAWSGENFEFSVPYGDKGAGYALIAFIGGTFLRSAVQSATAPSSATISNAKAAIAHGIQASHWETAFHDAFATEARKHGASGVDRISSGSSSTHESGARIEVTVRDASVGRESPHPKVEFAWGIHRPGHNGSVWWGSFTVESPEKKNFMAWGEDDGQALSTALRDVFRRGGSQLAKELYEGTDINL